MEHPSFCADIVDDGEPGTALEIAAQALRDFNHRTLAGMDLESPGWRYAPDAYTALGGLSMIASRLPQALHQVATALCREADAGRIRIDADTRFEANPDRAVADAAEHLEHASSAAGAMSRDIAEAQNAISAAAYQGPVPSD
jgi:hypothetical protein